MVEPGQGVALSMLGSENLGLLPAEKWAPHWPLRLIPQGSLGTLGSGQQVSREDCSLPAGTQDQAEKRHGGLLECRKKPPSRVYQEQDKS